jgi:serine/threonine-protein kinase
MLPAAIAVFAAALHRRAFDAERRAEKIGQYTLKRKLGEGGMGEVWLAEHGLLKRPCAVKFIRPDLAANPATAARFNREVQAMTGLSHVNTVRVYDYGRADDGSFYFVMEYLDGPTQERLTRTRMVLRTPAYMSPEQAAGESTVDARGDLYSLGAVAFFALTGRPPFQG